MKPRIRIRGRLVLLFDGPVEPVHRVPHPGGSFNGVLNDTTPRLLPSGPMAWTSLGTFLYSPDDDPDLWRCIQERVQLLYAP